MPLYMTVCTGPRANQARPILALSDQWVIRVLLRDLSELLASDEAARPDEPSGPVLLALPAEEGDDG